MDKEGSREKCINGKILGVVRLTYIGRKVGGGIGSETLKQAASGGKLIPLSSQCFEAAVGIL